MPTHKKGQDRDKYYQLAKDQGYRSRAAFKLIQINKRYDFLGKAKVCIDLCAAPGGWCQVAAKFMAPGSIVLGVDLLPIKPIRGVKTFVGDITTASTRKEITSELKGWKADVVLCDGAPNIGSAYNKDAFVQNELVLAALKTATEHLRGGGSFITKVYRSVDYNAIIWVLQQLFGDVQTMKPNSSRSQSSEIFLVCLHYTAPKVVDARLFDPNHVFKEVADPSLRGPDVLHKRYDVSNRRHRTGYDLDHAGILLHPTATVQAFVLCREPVRLLSDVSELTWDTSSEVYQEHPRTTEEVRLALKDLQVLGKIDFKKLLKWRSLMRDTYHAATPTEEVPSTAEEVPEEEVDEEVRIQADILTMRAALASAQHKESKKARAAAAKARARARLGIDTSASASAFEVQTDADLFSLAHYRGGAEVDLGTAEEVLAGVLAKGSIGDDEDEEDSEQEDGPKGKGKGKAGAAVFISEAEADLEAELEADYSSFMNRRQMRRLAAGARTEADNDDDPTGPRGEGRRTVTAKRTARAQGAEGRLRDMAQQDEQLLQQLSDDDEDEEVQMGSDDEGEHGGAEEEAAQVLLLRGKRKKALAAAARGVREDMDQYLGQLGGASEGVSSDEEDDGVHGHRQRVTRDAPSLRARTAQWFANPLFATSAAREQDDAMDTSSGVEALPEMPLTDKEVRARQRKRDGERRERKEKRSAARAQAEGDAYLRSTGGTSQGVQQNEEEDEEVQQGGARKKSKRALAEEVQRGASGFEIVARSSAIATPEEVEDPDLLPRQDDRHYDSDEEVHDKSDRLMTLALGTYMLRGSRKKALVDASYNRFAWNDPSGLPSWFLDDEMRHNKPQVPVPEALLQQIQAKYNLTGSKVIKKVAEARMRKKKRASAKLKAAKKTAAQMADNSELSERQKVKAIAKASRARGGTEKRPSKVYVATKKTAAGSVGTMGKGGGKGGGKLKFVDKRMKKEVRAAKANKRRSTKKRK